MLTKTNGMMPTSDIRNQKSHSSGKRV